MCVCIVCCAVLSHSVMSDSLRPHGPARLLCPWGFSRQEYWDGLSCPPPGNLPNPGIKPRSPALEVDSLLSESPGKPTNTEMGSLSLLQGNLPDSGIKAGSPALLADSLPAELPGKPIYVYILFLVFFSIMGYHRISSIVLCALQQDLVVYPFYI